MYGRVIFGGKVFWWRRYFVGGAEKKFKGRQGWKDVRGCGGGGEGGKGNKRGKGGKSLRELRGKKMEEEKNITMTGQSNQRKTREDRGTLLSNGCWMAEMSKNGIQKRIQIYL